ncbi:hypothetical protein QZH41_016763 [Actinostola sp. cb2023]|nr:hypothetical protein QZH41_016763 [Actinostola sp. cb2023]
MVWFLKQFNGTQEFLRRGENSKKLINTASNLLDSINVQSWLQLQQEASTNPIRKLVKSLDEIGILVANAFNTSENETIVIKSKNLAMKTSKISPSIKQSVNFTYQESSISLPAELFSTTKQSIEVTIVYLTLSELLKLPILNPTSHKDTTTVDMSSAIVSSVVTPKRKDSTQSFVKIVLANRKKLFKSASPLCVSWNPERHQDAWSDRGCHVITEETDAEKTTCACNHLTLFSFFMDPHQLPVNLIVLVKIISRIKNSQRLRSYSQAEKIKTSARATIATMPLLGVTWLFGVLTFHTDLKAFKYLFAICNSLQGVFIFIFHCLLDRQVIH